MTIKSVLEETGELPTKIKFDGGVTVTRRQWKNYAGDFYCGFWQLDEAGNEIHLIEFSVGETEAEAIDNMKRKITLRNYSTILNGYEIGHAKT